MKFQLNLISWIMNLAIIMTLAIPASALSGNLEYSVLGANIRLDTTYTLGDAIYTNSFTAPAMGSDLSYIHGKDCIGPDFSSALEYNTILNNPEMSWTAIQSMANGHEQAMIRTTMSGDDAIASYSGFASLTDLSFDSLLQAMTPAEEDILNNGYISIDQTYFGTDANDLPSEISQKVLASEQAKINLMGSFNLKSGSL